MPPTPAPPTPHVPAPTPTGPVAQAPSAAPARILGPVRGSALARPAALAEGSGPACGVTGLRRSGPGRQAPDPVAVCPGRATRGHAGASYRPGSARTAAAPSGPEGRRTTREAS
ncbi:hypothetical protein BX286_5966 [Streptomyces sp. 3211.6]|nr:hypothetical protein BX286_5966 [Streptomyces sp. 3211.6]